MLADKEGKITVTRQGFVVNIQVYRKMATRARTGTAAVAAVVAEGPSRCIAFVMRARPRFPPPGTRKIVGAASISSAIGEGKALWRARQWYVKRGRTPFIYLHTNTRRKKKSLLLLAGGCHRDVHILCTRVERKWACRLFNVLVEGEMAVVGGCCGHACGLARIKCILRVVVRPPSVLDPGQARFMGSLDHTKGSGCAVLPSFCSHTRARIWGLHSSETKQHDDQRRRAAHAQAIVEEVIPTPF